MALVWVLAFVLNRAEAEKATAQDALARSEKLLLQSQQMEAIGLLAGGVAHDFNNLLAVINGYSDLLLERPDLPESDRRSLEQIKQAGSSAASLTRQLLMLSRQQVIEPVVLNINQTVGNLDKMLRRLIKENIQFSFVLDPQLDRVKADPGQIEQIILNLVVNARDAMPSGGTLRIQTKNVEKSAAQAGPGASPSRFVLLEVTDTGTGMDQQTQAHIFEPFFTTKAVGKGTGLGLATVYGIVKQSNGYIEVQSTLGRGSSFQIFLPSEAQACAAVEPGKEATEAPFSGETILVVEDAAPLRDLICGALKRCRLQRVVCVRGPGSFTHPQPAKRCDRSADHGRHHAGNEWPGSGQTSPRPSPRNESTLHDRIQRRVCPLRHADSGRVFHPEALHPRRPPAQDPQNAGRQASFRHESRSRRPNVGASAPLVRQRHERRNERDARAYIDGPWFAENSGILCPL